VSDLKHKDPRFEDLYKRLAQLERNFGQFVVDCTEEEKRHSTSSTDFFLTLFFFGLGIYLGRELQKSFEPDCQGRRR